MYPDTSGAHATQRAGTAMIAELEALSNMLAEAERAGGRILNELSEQAESDELRELLRKLAHDEGYWAGGLASYVRRHGGTPSTATGDFVGKVRAVPDLTGKLELLNRGQRWVIRKIEEQIAKVDDARLRAFLTVMAESHRTNIEAVDTALKAGWQ
jgi:nitronate monooxygenase